MLLFRIHLPANTERYIDLKNLLILALKIFLTKEPTAKGQVINFLGRVERKYNRSTRWERNQRNKDLGSLSTYILECRALIHISKHLGNSKSLTTNMPFKTTNEHHALSAAPTLTRKQRTRRRQSRYMPENKNSRPLTPSLTAAPPPPAPLKPATQYSPPELLLPPSLLPMDEDICESCTAPSPAKVNASHILNPSKDGDNLLSKKEVNTGKKRTRTRTAKPKSSKDQEPNTSTSVVNSQDKSTEGVTKSVSTSETGGSLAVNNTSTTSTPPLTPVTIQERRIPNFDWLPWWLPRFAIKSRLKASRMVTVTIQQQSQQHNSATAANVPQQQPQQQQPQQQQPQQQQPQQQQQQSNSAIGPVQASPGKKKRIRKMNRRPLSLEEQAEAAKDEARTALWNESCKTAKRATIERYGKLPGERSLKNTEKTRELLDESGVASVSRR
ncbi:hypothetical protein DFP73DRAFT_524804 [Morchella snyderi]|nr:hypothetical protein DFP73DRAFT_524804 [Morchella snyderi]